MLSFLTNAKMRLLSLCRVFGGICWISLSPAVSQTFWGEWISEVDVVWFRLCSELFQSGATETSVYTNPQHFEEEQLFWQLCLCCSSISKKSNSWLLNCRCFGKDSQIPTDSCWLDRWRTACQPRSTRSRCDQSHRSDLRWITQAISLRAPNFQQ